MLQRILGAVNWPWAESVLMREASWCLLVVLVYKAEV